MIAVQFMQLASLKGHRDWQRIIDDSEEIMMDKEVVDWLLQAQTLTIRHLTLINLLGLAEDDARVVAQRRAIMGEGPLSAILAGQTEAGSWAGEQSYYTPKYRSTHWSLMLLTKLLVDGADRRFRRGSSPYRTRTWPELGGPEETGRWVTLQAARLIGN